MCSPGAKLGVSSGRVKQIIRCLLQCPALAPPFCHANPITKFEEWDEIFSRESEHIPKLGRYIDASRNQLSRQSRDQAFYYPTVVIALRLHLNDSPLALQKMQHPWNRVAVARYQ